LPLAAATGAWVGLGILYLVLLVTLGLMSLRKGHWVWFILGIFIPVCWLIGALLPRSREAREAR
jgi:ABC-type multidrug transport system permease subunit